MIPNANKLLSSAIRNKRRVVIRYDDQSRSRVVEPHALYKSKQGILMLLGYQIRGHHSSRRNGTYWRPFQLGKVDSIHVTEETFQPRLEQGYVAVAKSLKGEAIQAVNCKPSRYCYFNPALCGPPTPAYLAETPTQMVRIAMAAGA